MISFIRASTYRVSLLDVHGADFVFRDFGHRVQGGVGELIHRGLMEVEGDEDGSRHGLGRHRARATISPRRVLTRTGSPSRCHS